MFDGFDILKKLPDGGIVWIETAKDIETARERIKLFSLNKPGEYVIFCQETQSLAAERQVFYSRSNNERGTRPGKIKKTRTKLRTKTPAQPKTGQVIADIVADIARSLRHQR